MTEIHTSIELRTFADAPSRVRVPQSSGPHPVVFMIHGFKGDENAPWIFTRAAGPEWLIVSPRAPLAVPDGGFSWWQFSPEGKSDPESLQAGLSQLGKIIQSVYDTYPVDLTRVVLLGFSQGGAMSISQAIKAPEHVSGVVSLSGFIPGPVSRAPIPPLEGLPILIVHGTQDETIPIGMAYKARDMLIAAGGAVTYVEEIGGHKVGVQGMRALTTFLAERASSKRT